MIYELIGKWIVFIFVCLLLILFGALVIGLFVWAFEDNDSDKWFVLGIKYCLRIFGVITTIGFVIDYGLDIWGAL